MLDALRTDDHGNLTSGSRDPMAAGVVDVWYAILVQLLFLILVVIGVVRAASSGASVGGPAAIGSLVAAVHLVGMVRHVVALGDVGDRGSSLSTGPPSEGWTRWWLGAMLLAVGLAVAGYPDSFVWLLFPLGLTLFHRLPVPASLVMAVILIAGGLLALNNVSRLTGARIMGPVIGIVVAAGVAIGVRALQVEGEHRRRLIVELRETRELAAHRQREAGVLQERQRLARDIHDTVAQGLASILLLSSAIQRDLDEPPGDVAANLTRLREVAAQDLAATRRLIADLAPSDLEELDLAQALQRRCDRVAGSHPVAVVLSIESLPDLTRDMEVAVLRIVGQALDNAVAHSGAATIRVTVDEVADQLVIDVFDDGQGLAIDAPEGRGITGMRARAAALGGTLTVESEPDAGTVVAVEFPLDPVRGTVVAAHDQSEAPGGGRP